MFEWLVYTGGLADVEVPLDEPVGGYVIVDRDKAAKFPKETAEGLMQHGQNSDPDGEHSPQWRKATTKEIAAAEKEAAASDNDETTEAETTAPAKEGEQS